MKKIYSLLILIMCGTSLIAQSSGDEQYYIPSDYSSSESEPMIYVSDGEQPAGYVVLDWACAQDVINDDPFCINTDWDDACMNAYNDCLYGNGCDWYIPDMVENGPAIWACEAPVGYSIAYQPCAQEIILEDDYCVENDWDEICQDDYDCCSASGCVDPMACNYDADACSDDGSCNYLESPVADMTAINWILTYDSNCDGDDGAVILTFFGDQSYEGGGADGGWSLCNDFFWLDFDDSPGLYEGLWDGTGFTGTYDDGGKGGEGCFTMYPFILGCTDTIACNYNSLATADDWSCTYLDSPVTDLTAYNWTLEFDSGCNGSPGSVEFTFDADQTFLSSSGSSGMWSLCDGFYMHDYLISEVIYAGSWDGTGFTGTFDNGIDFSGCFTLYPIIPGCTDSTACNYDPLANDEDGSCILPDGCTDSMACNYDSIALRDDGTCVYGTFAWYIPNLWTVGPAIWACDGFQPAGYFLADQDCAQSVIDDDPYCVETTWDEICQDDYDCCVASGCVDPIACNYDSNAICDDGSCTYLDNPVTDMTTYNWTLLFDEDCDGEPSDVIAFFDDDQTWGGLAILGTWSLCSGFYMHDYDGSSFSTIYEGSWDGTGFTGTFDNGIGFSGCFTLYPIIPGCIDSTACNYDSTATIDDESCILPDGCTDSEACNYDSTATCDDGSCLENDECGNCGGSGTAGCTDSTACNYDSTADCDDGSCLENDECGNCGGSDTAGCTDSTACNYDSTAGCDDGSCLENDECGNCGGSDTAGCTDSTACNYDSSAGCDDGSCLENDECGNCGGSETAGCTDSTACNYDSGAGCDDGSCVLPNGCTDSTACNYDSTATCDDGSCLENDECGNCGGSDTAGCTDSTACNYDSTADCDDGSCLENDDCGNCGGSDTAGCTDSNACNYDSTADCDDGSCLENDECGNCGGSDTAGCTDSNACNYDSTADCDDGSCLENDECGNCGGSDTAGCTDSTACNYDSTAGCDDGSCVLPNGCTDSTACNYDSTATCDDGSCVFDCGGCTDSTACNYDSNATTDDGSCEYLPLYDIVGSLTTDVLTEETYIYNSTVGSSYNWSVEGGAIASGQGTNSVTAIWSTTGLQDLTVIETDAEGCVGQAVTIAVEVGQTGVWETNENGFQLFPNPAKDKLNVKLQPNHAGQEVEIRLYDAAGKLISYAQSSSILIELDVRDIARGTYIIAVNSKTISGRQLLIIN